jgi:hypothetical protein
MILTRGVEPRHAEWSRGVPEAISHYNREEAPMSKIKVYEPWVCSNKECMGYGDTVPAEYNRCFLCFKPLVHYSEIPYEDIVPFVRRVLEDRGNLVKP